MLQRILRSLLILPLVLLLVGMLPAQAQAAETWMPSNFNTGTQVYLSPGLKNGPRPISVDGLEAKLAAANKVHGLTFYVIVTEQGSEPNPNPNKKFAAAKLDEFVSTIQPKLPADKYVIVLVVRSNADPTKFSLGGQGGNDLQKWGMDASWFSSTLAANQRTYLPNDPAGYANAVANDVNAGITEHFAAIKRAEEQRERDRIQAEKDRIAAAEKAEHDRIAHEAFMKALPGNIATYGVPSVLLLIMLVLTLFYRKDLNELRRSLNGRPELEEKDPQRLGWEARFDKANTNYLGLKGAYFDFLQSQGDDWKKRFKNVTLATYTAAVTKFADLSARMKVALDLLTEARKGNEMGDITRTTYVAGGALVALAIGWLVTPLALWAFGLAAAFVIFRLFANRSLVRKSTAILESNSITVTGNALPQDMISLFGDTVESKTYETPIDMFKDMEKLFGDTNTALASIVESFRGARQNRTDIEQLTAAIEKSKQDLVGAGLNFAPYEEKFAAIKKDTDAFLAILNSDPMSAFTSSEAVEANAEALKAHIAKAVSLKGELAKTLTLLEAAAKRVTDVRGTDVAYTYALGAGETKSLDAGPKYTLAEANGNPDAHLNQAREHYAAAGAAVLAGDLTKSTSEKAAAEKSAASSNALVDDIFAAKAYVEKQVTPARTSLDKLSADIEPADKALAELRSEFLVVNFAEEPGKIDTAKRERDATAGELAKVKKAYDEQRYLAARTILSKQSSDIQSSLDALVSVHSRLAELRRLRSHAKAVVATTQQLATQLEAKLKTNEFTTSASTDSDFAALKPGLKAAVTDVAKDITDWPAAATAADSRLESFKKIDSRIDEEKKAYELAVQRVTELKSSVTNAESSVNHNDTRQPARTKLSEAKQALTESEGELKVRKSDWNAIGRRAETKKGLAAEAKRLAEADQKLASEARNDIASADREIDRVAARTFMQTAMWGGYSEPITWMGVLDLSTAKGYLREANSDLRNRDYEGAKSAASNARSAAKDAEHKADIALAAMVARKIAEWQEIERRKEEQRREEERRREEQRRRDEADAQRRRDEDNRRNNDNDWGGGGRSGGSDYSGGGRSGGAGDF